MNAKRALPHIHSYDVEKYKIVTLPIFAHAGGTTPALASDAADVAAGELLTVGGADNIYYKEVGSTGINALNYSTDSSDAGILFPIPYDMDVLSPVDFRVHWSSASTTTTDGITWKVLYTLLTNDETAMAAGATALTTAIAEDTNVAGANAPQKTAWGVLKGDTVAHDNFITLLVECDATDITLSSEATYAHFLDIRYVRRAL